MRQGRARDRGETVIIEQTTRFPGPKQLLSLIETSLDDDKAEEIVAIDLAGKSSICDYMVVATGRSQRQVVAMAEHLRERLKAESGKPVAIEGMNRGDWVLIDAGDVVVHLFRPEVRAFYNLEKMWGTELPETGLDRSGGLTA